MNCDALVHPVFVRSMVLVALLGAVVSSEVHAAAGALAADLSLVEGQIQSLERQQVGVDLLGDDAEQRLHWGEIYYLQKDYERASYLLFGAVESTVGSAGAAPVQGPGTATALFYLADSLFQLRNYDASRTFFERLLELRGHGFEEQCVLRLMQIESEVGRPEAVERHYRAFMASNPARIPGMVRYLHAKAAFLSGKTDAALQEFAAVEPRDPYALRSRYLIGAAMVKLGNDEAALRRFTEVANAKPMSKEDRRVKEMSHLARGRLLYESDKLAESIDAYQEIPYDSPLLTTMLYEVTWTYVRRGQIALRGHKDDNLTDLERRERAKLEYEKALAQLADLKNMEPDSARSAEIDILAGNLRLQRNEFERAEAVFGSILSEYASADDALQALLDDHSSRERVLQDIVQMSSGGLTVDSRLPPLAARRAASNEDVAAAVAVFKGIQKSREEVEATENKLSELEQQLSPDNPGRAELFKPLRMTIQQTTSLQNALLQFKNRILTEQRALVVVPPEAQERLIVLGVERGALEAKVASLPKTRDAIEQRRRAFTERIGVLDRSLHQAELEAHQRRAELAAIDFMMAQGTPQAGGPLKLELRKNQVREARAEVLGLEARAAQLRAAIEQLKRDLNTMGGRGSKEDALRQQYAALLDEERGILQQYRGAAGAPDLATLDALLARVEAATLRNDNIRARIDASVAERLAGVNALLVEERSKLVRYRSDLAQIDGRAALVRDRATELALERVRTELSNIVLRADVGIVDTSFARKQAETEKIGQLQRARAAELTDLTQAYADLTKDEAP